MVLDGCQWLIYYSLACNQSQVSVIYITHCLVGVFATRIATLC